MLKFLVIITLIVGSLFFGINLLTNQLFHSIDVIAFWIVYILSILISGLFTLLLKKFSLITKIIGIFAGSFIAAWISSFLWLSLIDTTIKRVGEYGFVYLGILAVFPICFVIGILLSPIIYQLQKKNIKKNTRIVLFVLFELIFCIGGISYTLIGYR